MFKSFFFSSLRAIKNQKFYAALNIFGLSIGIACSLLMLSYVSVDFSWDSFQKNSDRIYRVNKQLILPDQTRELNSNTPPGIGPFLTDNSSDISEFTRLYWAGRFQLKANEKQRYEDAAFCADSSFFKIFTYPLKSNNPENVLARPDHIVLRQDVAEYYFGDSNPLDKTIVMDDTTLLKVAGVYSIPDPGSFFQPNVILPTNFSRWDYDVWNDNWMQSFVLAEKRSDPISSLANLETEIQSHLDNPEETFVLQPFNEIHLHSDHIIGQVNWHPGDYTQVLIFLSVAILIIFLASINYTNLAIARASYRTREIGMRKAIGALRIQIAGQFLGESAVLVFISVALGVVFAKLGLPLISEITQRSLSIDLTDPKAIVSLLLLGVVISLMAGIYPALRLSAFKPVVALKGDPLKSKRFNWSRYLLLIFQFSATLLLLISISVIFLQMVFIDRYDVGFQKDNILLIRVENDKRHLYEPFFDSLQNLPGVLDVARTNGFPGWGDPYGTWLPEGKEKPIGAHSLGMGSHAPELFGLNLVQGRWLDSELFPTDEYSEADPTMSVLINETFVSEMNWSNPIGRRIKDPDSNEYHMQVVGVVSDFHQRSLRQQIQPTIIHLNNNYFQVVVKIDGNSTGQALEAIDRTWTQIVPDAEISRFFYDEDMFVVHYHEEERAVKLLSFFTFIALIVSILGMVGLASYTAGRRTRELGVRKILGATSAQLMGLIQKEFIVLIVVANVISWPIAWYIASEWLDQFMYRIEFPFWIFPVLGSMVLAVAMITTTLLTLRIVRSNPSEVLRHE